VRRDGLRLALIAAMQLLPAKQRAVLILRDVLEFSAAEVAEQLDTSVAAVNSALQRARAGVSAVEGDILEPNDSTVKDTIDRYVRAFEAADVATLVSLVTEDAVMEMPPIALWLRGRVNYGRFLDRVFATRGTNWRMVTTSANAQPALAAYYRDETGAYRLHTLQVFTVTTAGISHNVAFQDEGVFAAFGLTTTIDHH
jgi:RNA polymerase sigma-70 factor (ECF subfamily)